jgi:hypothetical protein
MLDVQGKHAWEGARVHEQNVLGGLRREPTRGHNLLIRNEKSRRPGDGTADASVELNASFTPGADR